MSFARLSRKNFVQDSSSALTTSPEKRHNAVFARVPNRIYPQDRFRGNWDLFMSFALTYTAIVTPVTIGFFSGDEPLGIVVLDWMVTALFAIDLLLNFNTVVFDHKTAAYLTDRRLIAKNYLMGWFLLDAVTVIPFDDFVESSGGASLLKAPRLVRLVRLVKLVKLVRVLRVGRIVQRWESRLGIRFGVLKLSKFVVLVLVLAHWNACLWFMVALIESDDELAHENWVSATTQRTLVSFDSPILDQYTLSVYWAVMTVTTIGYGDIVPNTTLERWMAIILMLIDAAVFAAIVGNITSLVQSLNRYEQAYQERLDRLNEYCRIQNLPNALKVRLREYFACSKSHSQAFDTEILQQMSPGLRGEVVCHTFKNIIERVPLFAGSDTSFITSVAVHLRPETYAPNELVYSEGDPCDKLYLISSGHAEVLGSNGQVVRVISEGSYFGEDMLMATSRRLSVRAVDVGYLCVFFLENAALEKLLEARPDVRQLMKAAAAKRLWDKGLTKTRTVRVLAQSSSAGDLEGEDDSSDLGKDKRKALSPLRNNSGQAMMSTQPIASALPPIGEQMDENSPDEFASPRDEARVTMPSLSGDDNNPVLSSTHNVEGVVFADESKTEFKLQLLLDIVKQQQADITRVRRELLENRQETVALRRNTWQQQQEILQFLRQLALPTSATAVTSQSDASLEHLLPPTPPDELHS